MEINIPEHASGNERSPSRVGQYNPSDKDKKLIKRVEDLFQKAKKYRERYDEDWIDHYKMFRGKQWKEERPPYRHSEVINMIFQNIQASVPILTDKRPEIQFLPQNPEDNIVVDILNEISRDDWERHSWLMVLTEALYDASIYGTAITHTGYDVEARDGLGNVVFETEEPLYCYPDPEARCVNVKSDYFIVAKPMSLAKIKAKWDNGKYVKADIDDFVDDQKSNLSKIKFKSPTENRVAYESSELQGKDKAEDRALVIHVCLKEDSVIEEKIEGENPGDDKVVRKLEYPKGRYVVVANGVLLQNDKNPYDDGEFPYERLVNYILPREFWGEGDVAVLSSPQRTFNKIISFVLDCLTLTGNPIWIIDNTSGVDSSNLFNSPGLIVEKQKGSEVRREAGTQLQPYVMQLIDRFKLWFDDLSGVNDVSRGATPSGVSAAIAIQSLQDAAQTRLRQKSRNLDAMLQKVGQHYLSRVLQFYSAPRVVRLTNNNSAVKFFKINVETKRDENDEITRRDLVVVPYEENDKKEIVQRDQIRFDMIRGFDVRVSTGSALPFARAEKEAKLLQYFDRDLIDRQEVLKNSDLPNWEAILRRMEEKEAAAAEAQAAAGGQQGV